MRGCAHRPYRGLLIAVPTVVVPEAMQGVQIHFGRECKPIKADDDPPLICQEGHRGQISHNPPRARPFSQRSSEGTCRLCHLGGISVRLQT
jgi:hypothetical protein